MRNEKALAARAESIVTASLKPELFAHRGLVSISRTTLLMALTILVTAGFGFRVSGLSVEGFGEDELNKLQAVGDYRAHGLTAANSEHPLFMKALQTVTVTLADKGNSIAGRTVIAPETALRFPSTVFGSLSIILIYLLAAELFGAEVGLIAAALWAFDPSAIGLNRVAKEDTFLLFFFLLANVFWLRGQRVAESKPDVNPEKYYWATAAAFGGMLASKYLPQALTISMGYYWLFQRIPETRWRLGKRRMMIFFLVMGGAFILLNPTILMPATWRQMSSFAGQKLVGHDAYEFMGQLYTHKMTDWLNGIPWYFYHVFVAVKLPLLSVVGFLIGLPLLFRRKLGDGRYLLILWLFLWMMTFSFTGGKFTRYFTLALPAVLITSAIGVQFASCRIARLCSRLLDARWPLFYVHAAVGVVVILTSLKATVDASPHFRLYTNALGGGWANAGHFFPHDEFYDASIKDAVFEIAKRAKPGAKIASETPTVATYYAQRANRPDMVCVSLSDPEVLKQLNEGDFIVDARGRRYFSNELVLTRLREVATPSFQLSLGQVHSASVYVVDQRSRDVIVETANQLPPLVKVFHPVVLTPSTTQ
ncbi:MAG TPA: glycosyltransferase family 39 protein [Pyrinomonadaceae bacterium]|nr:glycosyltransferase family 39 protein [Pyrinomonadaceae bacterium]